MSQSVRTLLLLIILAGILASAGLLYKNLTFSDDPAADALAPPAEDDGGAATAGDVADTTLGLAADFTVYDAAGAEHRLVDFVGQPIVLNFWASWCGPCRQEMDFFEDAYRARGEDVAFLMVNATDGTSETQASAQRFLDETGYTFPVYFDLEGSACSAYAITAFPTTWFIDAEGKLTGYHVGSITARELNDTIDKLLS